MDEKMIVYVKDFGKGVVKNIIKPYYFIKFEDGINRIVHEEKVMVENGENNNG